MVGEEEEDLNLSKPLKLTFYPTILLLEYWARNHTSWILFFAHTSW